MPQLLYLFGFFKYFDEVFAETWNQLLVRNRHGEVTSQLPGLIVRAGVRTEHNTVVADDFHGYLKRSRRGETAAEFQIDVGVGQRQFLRFQTAAGAAAGMSEQKIGVGIFFDNVFEQRRLTVPGMQQDWQAELVGIFPDNIVSAVREWYPPVGRQDFEADVIAALEKAVHFRRQVIGVKL